jgi:ABC-type nitrate/sulfonate/bicarbonate transport system substrate-binding protein
VSPVAAANRAVRLIVFPGGFNWPVWVAEDRGFFAQRGVRVEVATTPGSVFQWSALAEGRADLAITLMDNVVAYREGQGAPGVLVPDAIALMAVDTRAMPTLMTTPDIGTYAELKGKTLAVDALITGNALVLRGMLEHGELTSADYRLEQAGGVTQRFEAMTRQEYAGSLFNAPLDAELKAMGFHALDSASSLLSQFQGHVVATRRGWAGAHRGVVVDFLRALLDALDWLYVPANREKAFAIYIEHMQSAATDAAATAYSVLFDAANGFPANGEIDVEGIGNVLELRARYGEPRKTLDHASAYYDATFLAEAAARG